MSNVMLCEAEFTRHLQPWISENKGVKPGGTNSYEEERILISQNSEADCNRLNMGKIKNEINQMHQ